MEAHGHSASVDHISLLPFEHHHQFNPLIFVISARIDEIRNGRLGVLSFPISEVIDVVYNFPYTSRC